MHRRTFVGSLAVGILAAPLATEAQQAGKIPRIGRLVTSLPTTPAGQDPFYERLRELGWIYGPDFVVEQRAYGDRMDRIPDLAVELIRAGVDIFVSRVPPALPGCNKSHARSR